MNKTKNGYNAIFVYCLISLAGDNALVKSILMTEFD